MEEKYSGPHSKLITPSYVILTLIATILLGIGFFCFFVPLDATQRLFGSMAQPFTEYAVHLMVIAVGIFLFNAYTTYKRANKAKQSGTR